MFGCRLRYMYRGCAAFVTVTAAAVLIPWVRSIKSDATVLEASPPAQDSNPYMYPVVVPGLALQNTKHARPGMRDQISIITCAINAREKLQVSFLKSPQTRLPTSCEYYSSHTTVSSIESDKTTDTIPNQTNFFGPPAPATIDTALVPQQSGNPTHAASGTCSMPEALHPRPAKVLLLPQTGHPCASSITYSIIYSYNYKRALSVLPSCATGCMFRPPRRHKHKPLQLSCNM
ncbi:hypothetical protein J3F84DRAFT_285812 [Trichoderma pleuroticola]